MSLITYQANRAHVEKVYVVAGAMTEHPFIARYEAASKLITNHERVLRDLCRADEAHPTSQPELTRLPGQEAQINVRHAGLKPQGLAPKGPLETLRDP